MPTVRPQVKETRDDARAARENAQAMQRALAERRLQAAGLIALAAAVLAATVLRSGVRDVFLPGWWRLW